MSDERSTSQATEDSSAKVEDKALDIGGWLLIPAVGLAFAPFGTAASIYLNLIHLDSRLATDLKTALRVEACLLSGFVLFQTYVAVVFYRRHRSAPNLVIALLIARVAYCVIDWLLVRSLLKNNAGSDAFLGSLVTAAVWIPYFLLSKRVRATFVVGGTIGDRVPRPRAKEDTRGPSPSPSASSLPSTQPDYYGTLQVSPNADGEIIQVAYKRLVERWHADRVPGDASVFERLKLLDEAYTILSDPQKREEYELRRRQATSGAIDSESARQVAEQQVQEEERRRKEDHERQAAARKHQEQEQRDREEAARKRQREEERQQAEAKRQKEERQREESERWWQQWEQAEAERRSPKDAISKTTMAPDQKGIGVAILRFIYGIGLATVIILAVLVVGKVLVPEVGDTPMQKKPAEVRSLPTISQQSGAPELQEEFQHHRDRGDFWFKQGEYHTAIVEYNEALRIRPDHGPTYFKRGNAWMKQEKYDEAIHDFSEVIHLEPGNAAAYSARAGAWSAKGDYDRAVRDLDEAIRINTPRSNR